MTTAVAAAGQTAGMMATLIGAAEAVAAQPTLYEDVQRTTLHMARALEQMTRTSRPTHLDLSLVYRTVADVDARPQDLASSLRGLEANPAVAGLLEATPDLAVQLGREITTLDQTVRGTAASDRQALYEAESIRTSMMTTLTELQAAEARTYAEDYSGIRQYRKAIRGRLKDLERIRGAFQKGENLSPRLQQRWERFRLSYLGERENQYRGKVQQHLDLLRRVHTAPLTDGEDPLFVEMTNRQRIYLEQLGLIAQAEKRDAAETEMALLQANKDNMEASYHEAVEAFYFLKGYVPTTWNGSFAEIGRNFRWTQPATWIPPILLGGLTTFLAAKGIEPTSWDGAVFPAVRKRWEGDTLVIESAHPPQRSGLSQQALFTALMDTIRMQLALVNTAGIDPEGHNFEGFIPSWFQTALALTGATVRVEGLQKLKGLRDENIIGAPTHRGFLEYPILMGLEDEMGRPFRIVAKDSFRTNPVIRALVGLAMEIYGFPFIDRGAGTDAVRTMQNAGKKVLTGNKSVVTYPSASRSPTLVFDGERVEGPHYQAKHGIGFMAEAAGDASIVPMAFIGTGVATPKSMGEQKRGVPLGGTITVRIGDPFKASSLRTAGMSDEQEAQAVARHLDEAYVAMTGLPTGPLYRANPPFWKFWKHRTPRTIFQVETAAELEKGLQKRLKKPSRYRHSAVVLAPDWHPTREAVESTARRLGLPEGRHLTVYQATRGPDGTYSFPSYDIVG